MPSVKHLSADGATAISSQNWATMVSGLIEVDATPLKFGIENIALRALGIAPFGGLYLTLEQVGTNDGKTFFDIALDSATISKPWGAGTDSVGTPNGSPTATLSAPASGGVWGGTGIYGVVISAINASGETIASVEQTFNVSDVTQKVTYAWAQVSGATGYHVYRTVTPGTYGANSKRVNIVGGGVTTYIDDGSATSAGTPPAANTTGGVGPAYGTPPALNTFDQLNKLIASAPSGFAIGQQWFYWAVIKVPPGTSEIGNTRASRRLPKEI